MRRYKNFAQLQLNRELDPRYASMVQDGFRATSDFVARLGLYGELSGHTGCVNCLEWSHSGQILASGSDDVHVCLWDPFRKTQLASIATGHHGNIFTVKFVPNTGDRTVISGSADHSVRVHDIMSKEIISICACHAGRVKRCVTDPTTPHLFWSAGEDGVVMEHDLRTSHSCSGPMEKKPKNVLIDLKTYCGYKAEAKCLAVNPVRPEFMAIGANDPFVRIYDRRMISKKQGSTNSDIPNGAVQYLVPGHLPTKITEYKRKYRSLAATYVAYSPDGKELLVNLGGEQIYLFPLSRDLQKGLTRFQIPELPTEDSNSKDTQTKTNGVVNGVSKNGLAHLITVNGAAGGGDGLPIKIDLGNHSGESTKNKLSPVAENIKKQANKAFELKKYARAIHLYNEALRISPHSAILYSNRAAALLKRAWNGDAYTALKDCETAISLDSNFDRAHLRLCRCLFELRRFPECSGCIQQFKDRFPNKTSSVAFKTLHEDLQKNSAIGTNTSTSGSSTNSSPKSTTSTFSTNSVSSSSSGETNDPSTIITRSRNYFLRFSRGGSESNSSTNERENENTMDDEIEFVAVDNSEEDADTSNDNIVVPPTDSSASTSSFEGSDGSPPMRGVPFNQESELLYRSEAIDFTQRFCGHCNTTTDIKEANFFGGFVVAGSDDGSFFIWDRDTTNIVKIIKGDESIVNCLQPHPNYCMLATSGIESVVRLWAPTPEDGKMNDRVVEDVNDAAYANQKRMNSNPFEIILMNMGYRLNGEDDASDEEASQDSGAPMQCNPT